MMWESCIILFRIVVHYSQYHVWTRQSFPTYPSLYLSSIHHLSIIYCLSTSFPTSAYFPYFTKCFQSSWWKIHPASCLGLAFWIILDYSLSSKLCMFIIVSKMWLFLTIFTCFVHGITQRPSIVPDMWYSFKIICE